MSGKVPPSSRAKTRSPISRNKDVQRAARLYEKFSGHEAEAIGRLKVPPMPRVGVAVGEVDFIGYTTMRDGVTEKYIHKFKSADKPLFVVSPDGRQLYMVDGRYSFTERGIVDKTDKSG
ncbi:MAG: hypothetical protein IPO08_23550 [Xanthomonadales bacterium]|nr:hypothetical protein [Xanthomonadales bacterium]